MAQFIIAKKALIGLAVCGATSLSYAQDAHAVGEGIKKSAENMVNKLTGHSNAHDARHSGTTGYGTTGTTGYGNTGTSGYGTTTGGTGQGIVGKLEQASGMGGHGTTGMAGHGTTGMGGHGTTGVHPAGGGVGAKLEQVKVGVERAADKAVHMLPGTGPPRHNPTY